jgi:hypothetical protein
VTPHAEIALRLNHTSVTQRLQSGGDHFKCDWRTEVFVLFRNAYDDCSSFSPLWIQRRENDVIKFRLGQRWWQANLIPCQLAVDTRIVFAFVHDVIVGPTLLLLQ